MKASPILEKVPLKDLSGEEQYRLSYYRDIDHLLRSISAAGLSIPLLCRDSGRGLELFSGFMRRDAMIKLGKGTALVLVFNGDEMSEQMAFRYAFFENASGRGLNLAEQAKAVKRFKDFKLSEREILSSYFQLAGIPCSIKSIELLELFWGLKDEWKRYLTEKEINIKHLFWFLGLGSEEQDNLKFLIELHLSSSQLRESLEMIEEILKRDRISQEKLVKSLAVDAILNDEKLSSEQKRDRFFSALRRMRFPEWEKLSGRYKRILAQMKLPEGVKIEPMDYFEEKKYRMEIILEEDQEIKKIFNELLKAVGDHLWQKLFEIDDED